MHFVTREKIRLEVKTMAYRRINAKKVARRLRQAASKDYQKFIDAGKIIFGPEHIEHLGRADTSNNLASTLDNQSSDVRYLNVAYGLLRGREYKQIERKTNTPLNPKKLMETIHKFCFTSERKEWTEERIKEVLTIAKEM